MKFYCFVGGDMRLVAEEALQGFIITTGLIFSQDCVVPNIQDWEDWVTLLQAEKKCLIRDECGCYYGSDTFIAKIDACVELFFTDGRVMKRDQEQKTKRLEKAKRVVEFNQAIITYSKPGLCGQENIKSIKFL